MIPLQQDMNPDDPVEHVLWALVNMGGLMGAPLGVPMPLLRTWAQHLYDCGFRHDPSKQVLFYSPPADGEGFLSMGGTWVQSETPGVEPDSVSRAREDAAVDEAISSMTTAQRRALIEKLESADDGYQ